MKFQDHCDECQEKLGEAWPEVHRWLDEYAKETFPLDTHRIHRHHEAGVEEVERKWGSWAAKAAKLHILADVKCYGLDHVPTFDEAQKLWSDK